MNKAAEILRTADRLERSAAHFRSIGKRGVALQHALEAGRLRLAALRQVGAEDYRLIRA